MAAGRWPGRSGVAALAAGLVAACASAPSGVPATEVPALEASPRLAWRSVDSLDARLPPSVRVLAGRSDADTLRAWAVRLAPGTELRIEAAADATDGREGPSETARRTGACVVLNGGYFDLATGAPVGLLFDAQRGGAARLVSPATRRVVRDGQAFPVARGAVGVGERVEVATARDAGGQPCRAEPVANRPGGPGPDVASCAPWPVAEALGAGPVLLRGGRLALGTDVEAFFGTAIPDRNPRSAVGVAPDGTVWLVVVDGRQAASRGATLPELARLLRDLGAEDALNLDGGGSSALVVQPPGGAPVRLNRPTGYDVEREVATALAAGCPAPR